MAVDSNQLLSGVVGFGTLIIPDGVDCCYKCRAKGSGSDKKICNISQNPINTGYVEFCSWLYKLKLGGDIFGNITRIDNEIEKIPDKREKAANQLETLKRQLEYAKVEMTKEFP